MCGFVGFLSLDKSKNWEHLLVNMTSAIMHRGPDAGDTWIDQDAGVALGHRRLAIVDLSPTGSQPMHSHSGKYVIAFNGEIYNFKSLKGELEALGVRFIGSSDTEVVLSAFENWGIQPSLDRFVGMFAFSLWDRTERRLYLARDRMGEKPLYYGFSNGKFLFGSELKAIRAHKNINLEINRDSITLLLRHNYIPSPYSIFTGIFKLTPGTYISLTPENIEVFAKPIPYWSIRDISRDSQADKLPEDDRIVTDEFNSLLRDSVSGQMMADVPIGAFLSGGIDSSLVVSTMQSLSIQPVKTFTIGFEEDSFDEAPYARAIAAHLGTEHQEHYISSNEALSIIPRLPHIYDEPFSDSSQIPTILVSQLAKSKVTVCLSGDGGDELFYGYQRYEKTRRIWESLSVCPYSLRHASAALLKKSRVETWNQASRFFEPFVGKIGGQAGLGEKVHKLAEVIDASTSDDLYRKFVSHWKNPEEIVIGGTEPSTVFTDSSRLSDLKNIEDRMTYFDELSYLPDDILVKIDRAGMSVSLESRIPLLDHRIVEFSWRLPPSMKMRNNHSKWLLRQALYQHVPKSLIERPKMGFGVPIGEWLRGPLKEWAESLLDENRLRDEGYFSPRPIREKWEQHLSGLYNWHGYLWTILMFQSWLELNKSD